MMYCFLVCAIVTVLTACIHIGRGAMKHFLVQSCLLSCLMVGMQQTIWKVGVLKNESDLQLQSAWYEKKNRKLKQIEGITEKLHEKREQVLIMSSVGVQGGVSLIQGVDMQGNLFKIFFETNPVHAIHWGRAKAKKIDQYQGKNVCELGSYSYCATVFIQREGVTIASAAQGYDQEEVIFDVKVVGNKGVYHIVLEKNNEVRGE